MVSSPPASVSVTPQYSQAKPARSRTSRRVAAEILTFAAPRGSVIARAARRHFRAEAAHFRRSAPQSAAPRPAGVTPVGPLRPEASPETGEAAHPLAGGQRAQRYLPRLAAHTMRPAQPA